MQSIKPIILSLLFFTVLSAIEEDIDCQPGEYYKQGTTTCIPGDITVPPGIFLPSCTDGERLVQGSINDCIVTTPVTHPGLFLPDCKYGGQLIQGTDQCIERLNIITHNSAAGGDGSDIGFGVTLDNFGNIYVTGQSENSSGQSDMAIWKYKNDGILDTTFGTDGIVIQNSATGLHYFDSGYAITLDDSGNIYVTGITQNNNSSQFFDSLDMVIWKYKSNGTLDTTFNSTGVVIHGNAAGGDAYDGGNAITLDDSGNIYVTGHSENSRGTFDMVIWKYKNDGTLDTTLDSDGIVTYSNAENNTYLSNIGDGITLDNSGNIYVTGLNDNSSGNNDMVIWKYKSDGTLDTTFDLDGIIFEHGSAGGNGGVRGYDIVLDDTGNIYVTGNGANSKGRRDMVIWKYKSDGTPDITFDSDGIAHHNVAEGDAFDSGYGISVDKSGYVYVTGQSQTNNGYNKDMAIWKYKNNGVLDTTFDSNGILIYRNDELGDSHGYGIVLDDSNNIYVTGQSFNSSGNTDMTIWIYK